jgi:hypothetical protein
VTLIHGHRKNHRKSRTYNSWAAMKERCLNPHNSKYSEYGGRGISVCERWMQFKNFLQDMGKRPRGKTLDRIDPDGGYSPDNCRWSTAKQQRCNQRRMYDAEVY